MSHFDNDKVNGSASQQSWIEIAEGLRCALQKKKIKTMSAAEMYDLARATRELFWLEVNARTFDREVDTKQRNFT